ncbi:MAG: hypothetical protein AABW73_02970 [Nanoarchaeota archaeon]
MRELTSREEIEKKEKRNKTTLGIIMVLLMLLSTAGYALLNYQSTSTDTSSGTPIASNPSGQIVEYNKIKFVGQESGLWLFEVQGNTFYSSYTPEEVKHINVPFINIQAFSGQTVYYSGNILAAREILTNINPYIIRSQEACLQESNISNQKCEDNLPIKDCTNTFLVITEVGENETSRVTTDNKCIIIKSKDTELLKTADALLFRILGVQ